MKTRLVRVAVALVVAAALAWRVAAQAPSPSPSATPSASASAEEEVVSPTPNSPDGKFGFITDANADSDTPAIDLIDAATKKVIQRIDEEEMSNVGYSVLWSDDSSRFALMTRLGHPNQGVDIFFRNGNKFRKIKLPKLPEASIPTKMRRGKEFQHVAANNWTQAEKWKKDGSLDLSIVTTIDGASTSITATRDLTLTFDKSGKAKIARSTIKYETDEDDEK
ncbi:MAG TPA: hypothetical protein VLK27_12065 [Chthoniobacterales bacterium]|nr:hypothetical protein [Chthoniobacterales bacterium]